MNTSDTDDPEELSASLNFPPDEIEPDLEAQEHTQHPALLVDPQRIDQQDAISLIEQAEAAATTILPPLAPTTTEPTMKTRERKPAATIPAVKRGKKGKTEEVVLPPLSNAAEDTELTGKTPQTALPDATERRARIRGEHEAVWSTQTRLENPARKVEAERRAHLRPLQDAWDDDLRHAKLNDPESLGIHTKEYIEHAGDADANAKQEEPEQVLTSLDKDGAHYSEATPPKMILLNPFTSYLPQLAKIDDFADYRARNTIAMSLGYAVVLDILSEYRASLKKDAEEPQPEDDIELQKFKDDVAAERAAERSYELGYVTLPPFHAKAWAGAYHYLVLWQRADEKWGPKQPVTTAHQIMHALYTGQVGKDEAMAAAYSMIETQIIGETNPALANILQARNRLRGTRTVEDKARHDVETAYVVDTINETKPVRFTDDIWYELPIYVQVRYSTMVYNRIRDAAAFEAAKRNNTTNWDKVRELSMQLGVLHLELELAYKDPIVIAAFAQGKLDERHDVRSKAVIAPAPTADTPTMKRGPAPDTTPDTDTGNA